MFIGVRARRSASFMARSAFFSFLMMGLSGFAYADANKGALLADQGNSATGLPACAACHGDKGAGLPYDGPRLAGLDKNYILKQLADFRAGRRISPLMQPVAQAMSTADAEDLADYYSGVTAPSEAESFAPGVLAKWRRIAVDGKSSLRMPACETCHAPGGIGVVPNFPYLAGQKSAYIESQLQDWRIGKRRNDPLGVMKSVARKLSPSDIRAVAAYFASLAPPSRQGGGK